MNDARRLLAWCALAGVMLVAAPAQAQNPLDLILGVEPKESEEDKSTQEQPTPDVLNVEALSTWRERFTTSWMEFFQREPFAVNLGTFTALKDELVNVGEDLQNLWNSTRASPSTVAAHVLPTVVLVIVLFLFTIFGDRQMRVWARRARDNLDKRLEEREGLRTIARVMLHTVTLLAIPVLLQVVAGFGVEILYGANPGLTRLLGVCVFLVLLYRLALAVLVILFHEPLAFLDAPEPSRLERLLTWTLRLLLTCLIVLIVTETAKYPPDVIQIVRLMLQLVLFGASIGLSLLKHEVMELLPERSGEPNSFIEQFRRFNSKYYQFFVGASTLLIILWAVGFTRAATFLLVRGYTIFALITLAGFAQRRIDNWVRRRQIQMRTAERRAQALFVGRALNGLLFVVTFVLALTFLEVDETLLTIIDTPLFNIGPAQISVFRIVKAVLVVVVFIVISRMLRPLLNNSVYPRFGIDIGAAYAINAVLHYSLVVMGLAAGLTALQIPSSSLLFLASALSLGIGFGFQDIAKNLISGFILLFGRAVKKGDTVAIDEHYGVIESVGARSVTLMTPDYSEIVIPSSELVSQPITNYSYTSPRMRVHVPIGVHYGSDVRHVEQALLNAAFRHEEVLHEPEPSVWFVGFGDNSINFELLVWINVRRIPIPQLRGELNFHIWDVLKEQNIEIPYPQRDLHLKPTADLESLVRAIRNEPPLEPEPEPEKPTLAVIPSYLNTRQQELESFGEDAERQVIDSLRDLGSTEHRARQITETTERFFTGRLGSLEREAESVRARLAEVRQKKDEGVEEAEDDEGIIDDLLGS